MSFFGSLFNGSNKTLSGDIAQTGQLSNFSAGQGQANTTAGSGFFQSLLSGDNSKIAKSLAPEISTSQQQGQQAKKANAEQGSRSGGTAASNANIDAAGRGNIINLVGGAQGGAASALLSSGNSLLGTALSGYGQQADLSAQQAKGWASSLFGDALGQVTGAAVSGGVGGLGTKVSKLGSGDWGW